MKTNNDSGWKTASQNVFLQQLDRNMEELYFLPEHWVFFIQKASEIKGINRIVDIGCGAGSLFQVVQFYLGGLGLAYIGYDYSESAIEVANKAWGNDNFIQKDYAKISKEEIFPEDLLVANALCDVSPEGDLCLETLLKIGCKHLLILRVETTEEESFYRQYRAYGEVDTYSFHHNEKKLKEIIAKHKYQICSDANHLNNIHLERFEK